MKAVRVYLNLYASCLRLAVRGIKKSPWTLLLPLGLFYTFHIAEPLLAPLGIVGGFLLALALDAVYSCYLYFVGEVVSHSKVHLGELKKSFGAYFWSVLNLFFVLWVVRLVLNLVIARTPNAGTLSLAVWLLTLVVLNAAPEVIYLRGTRGGVDTIQRSVKFLQENWIEWFIPNLVGLAALYFLLVEVVLKLPLPGFIASGLVGSAFFHLLMVFRGYLFRELDGSSHRQRMFKFRVTQSGEGEEGRR
ncbi:MAG: hypothetical protein ACOZIN_21195 [Myxococcota bacterium]